MSAGGRRRVTSPQTHTTRGFVAILSWGWATPRQKKLAHSIFPPAKNEDACGQVLAESRVELQRGYTTKWIENITVGMETQMSMEGFV